jgi:glycosyltransferase involved in cell wall biosynthesis
MILFLGFLAEGKRGGEVYTSKFLSFLVSRFPDVIPRQMPKFPPELKSIFRHAIYNYRRVARNRPALIITDVSSGLRDILAVYKNKKQNGKLLLVIQEQRVTYRINNPIAKRIVRACEKYYVRRADIILVNSEYSANIARNKGLKEKTKVIIANPGLQPFPHVNKQTEYNYDGDDEPLKLLFVGECIERKGVKYIIEALGHLKDQNIILNFAGKFSPEDPYCKNIANLINRLGLKDRVSFYGFLERDELEKLYRSSSIFILASISEGYGMVLAEAMNFGLPIIATTAGAIPELVTDGVNGILVRPANSKSIAAAISKLYENKELIRKFSRNNLERIKNLSTWEDFENKLEKELVPAIEQIAGIGTLTDSNSVDLNK